MGAGIKELKQPEEKVKPKDIKPLHDYILTEYCQWSERNQSEEKVKVKLKERKKVTEPILRFQLNNVWREMQLIS